MSRQWESGLVEIHYPHEWYNVRPDDTWIFLLDSHDTSTHSVGGIALGYYDGPGKLAGIMGTHKAKHITQKVTLHMTPLTVFVTQYSG